MLDIKLIRENTEKIKKSALDKGVEIDTNHILEIDAKYRELSMKVQELREQRNNNSSAIKGKPTDEQLEEGKRLKIELDREENALKAVEEELNEWLLKIPNPAKDDVKFGKNDTENDVIKTVGEPTKFNFTPKDHLEIGQLLDIIDVVRAAKVSGARFYYLKNEGALLEFALLQFALDTLMPEGFVPVIPPVLIKTEMMRKLGYMENGGEEDMFHLREDGLTLVGTAEHALVSMHADEVLDSKKLPIRYLGYSPSFRREAGSYGKDTKGILRVHQFDKVEMVSFVEKGKDDEEHEYLLSLEEKLFDALKIPYQVVKMCTGDLGFPAARKFDIEAWMPYQDKYREVTSVSTVTDFQ
ncbi:MAG: serine--tRNA ligase, partial [Ignavibacteria bacterium]|nr:serine--tRNA ligase [Ignavibacteria bacterium]